MKIAENSRQVPKKQEYVSAKDYSDIVYAWFQVNSSWDQEPGECRYLEKKKVVFSAMEKEIGLSRQTISRRVKKLIELGLLIENKEAKRYELPVLPENVAMLIEQETLRKMVSALNENTISVYVYLLGRYIANKEQSFEIVLRQVKTFLGMGLSDSTNYRITDILDILQKLELVEYEKANKHDPDGKVRTIYIIKSIRNKIP